MVVKLRFTEMKTQNAKPSVEQKEQSDLHIAIANALRRCVASEEQKEPLRIGNAITELHRAAEAVDLQQQAVEQRDLTDKKRGQQHTSLIQRFQKRFDPSHRRARLLQRLHDRFPRETAVQRARRQQIQQGEDDQNERKRVGNQQNPEKQHRVVAPIKERSSVHSHPHSHFESSRKPQSRLPFSSSVSAALSAFEASLRSNDSRVSPIAPSCELEGFEEGGRSRSGVSDSGGRSNGTRNNAQSAKMEANDERTESQLAEWVPKRLKQTESQAGGEDRMKDKSETPDLRVRNVETWILEKE